MMKEGDHLRGARTLSHIHRILAQATLLPVASAVQWSSGPVGCAMICPSARIFSPEAVKR